MIRFRRGMPRWCLWRPTPNRNGRLVYVCPDCGNSRRHRPKAGVQRRCHGTVSAPLTVHHPW